MEGPGFVGRWNGTLAVITLVLIAPFIAMALLAVSPLFCRYGMTEDILQFPELTIIFDDEELVQAFHAAGLYLPEELPIDQRYPSGTRLVAFNEWGVHVVP